MVRTYYISCDADLRLFYSVEVHPTQESMERAVADLRGCTPEELHEEGLEAICLRYKIRRKKGAPAPRHDQIGTLFFVEGQMPFSTVVHELTHAAVGWAKRKRNNPLKTDPVRYERCQEEKFARTLQHLVEQFYAIVPMKTQKLAA